MNISYFKWRPVLEQVATLQEISDHWTINDLADCHEALDLMDSVKAHYHLEAERLSKQQAEHIKALKR